LVLAGDGSWRLVNPVEIGKSEVLVTRNGVQEKPIFPCLVEMCPERAVLDGGACRKHMSLKVQWLIGKVVSGSAPLPGEEPFDTRTMGSSSRTEDALRAA
jgi:hypothetical protein